MAAGVAVALAGLLTSPLEPCLRSLWPTLLSTPEKVSAAYAFDAAAQEIVFVVGPLLVMGSINLGGERFALVATGVIAVVGTLAFVTAAPVRSWRAEPREPDWAGPLRSEMLRALLLALLCAGAAVGTLSLLFTAYAELVQRPSWTGLLLGIHALGGLAGGLAYGARVWSGSACARLVWLFAGLSLGYFPLATVPSPVPMLGLALLGGIFLAPVIACSFVVVGEVVPKGTTTEAFAWVVTVFTAGTALGAAASGALLQHVSLAGALILPGLFCAAALGVLLVVRHFCSRGFLQTSP
jgi:predicted MFS family arabinose efflux permease